jgi:lipopolysaccharide/colanic/teichoic acid biosynthesis glycosyltransferase
MAKRAIDIMMSLVGLILLAPVLGLIAFAIRVTSSGPALYRGTRIGTAGRSFEMLKFRTMLVGADRLGGSSTPDDDPRVTRIGGLLRRYKLDELPQLWNVLVGDMSLIGPRPQVGWAVQRFTDEEKILLTVRPGITDPASLRFANEGELLRGHSDPDRAYFELIHSEKMRLSIHYVKNRSFVGDLKILVATVGAAIGRRPVRTGLPERDTSTSTS